MKWSQTDGAKMLPPSVWQAIYGGEKCKPNDTKELHWTSQRWTVANGPFVQM